MLFCDSGYNRSCAGTGTAAHTAGNEYHICTLDRTDGSPQRSPRLPSGQPPALRLRQVLWLAFSPIWISGRCLAQQKRLLIGIDSDKLHSCDLYHQSFDLQHYFRLRRLRLQ